jgi:hypothetical protein
MLQVRQGVFRGNSGVAILLRLGWQLSCEKVATLDANMQWRILAVQNWYLSYFETFFAHNLNADGILLAVKLNPYLIRREDHLSLSGISLMWQSNISTTKTHLFLTELSLIPLSNRAATSWQSLI